MRVSAPRLVSPGEIAFSVDGIAAGVSFDPSLDPFVSLSCDAPVLAVLQVALERGEDIIAEGSMSRELFESLQDVTTPMMTVMEPSLSQVQISCSSFSDTHVEPGASVVTALSCGIDSLCCVKEKFLESSDEDPNRLTHLLLSEAGAAGFKHELFNARLANSQECADKLGLPLLGFRANFGDVNGIGHGRAHVLRNLAIPLFFQGLFRRVYYGSGRNFETSMSGYKGAISTADPIVVPSLSTERTKILLHGARHTRISKTRLVAALPSEILRHLNVCVKHARGRGGRLTNCGGCRKCLRLALTLRLTGLGAGSVREWDLRARGDPLSRKGAEVSGPGRPGDLVARLPQAEGSEGGGCVRGR